MIVTSLFKQYNELTKHNQKENLTTNNIYDAIMMITELNFRMKIPIAKRFLKAR